MINDPPYSIIIALQGISNILLEVGLFFVDELLFINWFIFRTSIMNVFV